MSTNRITFPSFTKEDYSGREMRQFISALELRLQALEAATTTLSDADTTTVAAHTHVEADISDFGTYLTSPVGQADGGTGITSYTKGDILYAGDGGTLMALAIGSNSEVLQISGGVPTWQAMYTVTAANATNWNTAYSWGDHSAAGYLTSPVGETDGGTGATTYATGDILYASATNTLSKLAATTNGYVLTLASGVPSWAAASGGGGQIEIKTADQSKTSDATLANDNHLVGFTFAANTMYLIEALLIVDGGTGGDFQFRFDFDQTPVSAALVYTRDDLTENTALSGATRTLTGSGIEDDIQMNGLAAYRFSHINGYVLTHATNSGTMDFQWAQLASSTTATTLYTGSWVRFTPV